MTPYPGSPCQTPDLLPIRPQIREQREREQRKGHDGDAEEESDEAESAEQGMMLGPDYGDNGCGPQEPPFSGKGASSAEAAMGMAMVDSEGSDLKKQQHGAAVSVVKLSLSGLSPACG